MALFQGVRGKPLCLSNPFPIFFNFPIRAFQDFIKKEPLDSLASPVRYKAILAIRHLR